jgi:hypothetical protein
MSLVTVLPPGHNTKQLVAAAARDAVAIGEPAAQLSAFVIVGAASWAFLLYFGLLMFAFLWSLSEARHIYAWIFATKAINWIIVASVVTGIWFYVRYLDHLRRRRSSELPVFSNSAADPPRTPRKTGGVYGRARNADDFEIDAALQGKMGGFDAMFEE